MYDSPRKNQIKNPTNELKGLGITDYSANKSAWRNSKLYKSLIITILFLLYKCQDFNLTIMENLHCSNLKY